MENQCPQCGAPLPSGGLAGLCPACLLKQAATDTATQPETPPFQPPTVEELARLFPQLEIIALIGKGGMGAVYQARQPALDRIVALKILPPRVEGGADFTERFNREARALAKLNHPNIVTVHEFGQVNGLPFFIMEYVDGLNLRQLEQAGKLTPREALQIVPQICEALQFAHDAGIVHRDIKPDNILLDKKGRVKIADFGIAKIMGGPPDSAVPETQGAIGTPHYMAPEQVEKPQTVDHRADIFSLGVVFYEMLTGELPLGKFAPPSSGPRGLRVDVRLDEVVLRALEKEPERRYQHASQVKTAVEAIASTPPGTPPNAPQPHPPVAGPSPEILLARDYTLDIGSCLHRGWAMIKANFWPLVGMHALIWLLVLMADSAFERIGQVGNQVAGTDLHDGTSILGLVLAGPLWGGLFLYFLKTMRGEPVMVETAFAGFSKRFLHLFLVNLVSWFLIALGFVCLILPGIYLLVAWSFALVLVMDKGLEFWPAMELSRKLVHKHWWQVFACLLVLASVWVLGLFGCFVGVLISAPVALTVFLYAYEDIFGNRTPAPPVAGQPVPPPPMAGAGAAKPAGAVIPPAAVNSPSPSGPSAPPLAAASPGGPLGPSGTIVMPAAPAPPPPPPAGDGGRFLKYLLMTAVGVMALLLVVGIGFFSLATHEPATAWLCLIAVAVVLAVAMVILVILYKVLFRAGPPAAKTSATGGGLNRFLNYGLLITGGLSFILFVISVLAVMVMHNRIGGVMALALGGWELIIIGVFLLPLAAISALVLVCLKMIRPATSLGGSFKLVLKGILLAILALLSALLLSGLLLPLLAPGRVHGNWSYSYSTHAWHSPQPLQPLQPGQPLQPLSPPQPPQLTPPGKVSTTAYDSLVGHVRQELGRVSVRFDQLHLSTTNGSQLLLTFSGLQELRLVDGTNAWQDITGSLAASRLSKNRWVFEGQEALSLVRFDLTGLSLKKVLATAHPLSAQPPGDSGSTVLPGSTQENLADRLAAAQTIADFTVKDQALQTLSLEAANDGEVDLVKSALGQMSEFDKRDAATREAVLVLARNGHRKEAIEIAEGISQFDVRDKTLAELAQ